MHGDVEGFSSYASLSTRGLPSLRGCSSSGRHMSGQRCVQVFQFSAESCIFFLLESFVSISGKKTQNLVPD